MDKTLIFVLFILTASLQLIASEKETDAESTSVSDFSRCKKIKIKQLHIDDEVCVKIAFVKADIGIEISITWDGKVIFKTKVSVKQPPPLCFGVPLVKKLQACLKLSDVSWEPHHHGACLSIELKALMIHKTFKLGCIYKDIQDKKKKTPLEILQAVRALVNADDGGKSGNEKIDELVFSDQSGNKIMKKNILDMFYSRGNEDQDKGDNKMAQTCVCSKDRQCICCKNIVLSPPYRTRVCGKVIVTPKGKGIWISLLVNDAKHFRVYTPVSRRFNFVCGKLDIHNVKAVVCLHLRNVVKTEKGIKLCLSVAINVKLSRRRLSLGCMTVNLDDHLEKSSDDVVKFKPLFKDVF